VTLIGWIKRRRIVQEKDEMIEEVAYLMFKRGSQKQ